MSDDKLSVDDLRALVDSGKELAAEINLPIILEQVLTTAGVLTGSSDGSVMLFNPTGVLEGQQGTFYFAAAVGEKASELLETRGVYSKDTDQVPMTSIAGQVFNSGNSTIKNSVPTDPAHNKTVDVETKFVTSSMICVPLTAAGEKIGVVQILNKQSGIYTERDQLVLEAFANQAAVAIRNARLFRDVLAHMGFQPSAKMRTIDIVTKLKEPARREYLTLFMPDMRGFTQLCNVINDPERIQRFLNMYFEMLNEQVVTYGGMINKFLGDGLLAFFREPGHEQNAVRCAFTIIECFPAFVSSWKRQEKIGENIKFVDIGIGIVSDSVIIGTIGSAKVRDFTAIGSPVNLVSSLQHCARDGKRILVNETTLEAVKEIGVEYEGPFDHILQKPGQTFGHPYEMYHLKSLRMGTRAAVERSAESTKIEIHELYINSSKYQIKGGQQAAVGDAASALDFEAHSDTRAQP